MDKFQEIIKKILQMSAKAKMITAGGIAAACAVGAIAYYISIPKLSDVEEYKNNNDVTRMTKLITSTLKSGDKYKDVQDKATQALIEMNDEKGNKFLIGCVTDNANGYTVQTKKEILEALAKSNKEYVYDSADTLFDYAANKDTDESLRKDIVDIAVKDNISYVKGEADKLFNYALNSPDGELKDEIVDSIIYNAPWYIGARRYDFREKIIEDDNKLYVDPLKTKLIAAMYEYSPGIIGTLPYWLFTGPSAKVKIEKGPWNASANEKIYNKIFLFAIDPPSARYISAKVTESVVNTLAGDTSDLERLATLDSVKSAHPDFKNICEDAIEQYRNVLNDVKNYNVDEKINSINNEIKNKEFARRALYNLLQNSGDIVDANVRQIYITQGTEKALNYEAQAVKEYTENVKKFFQMENEMNALDEEKRNVYAKKDAMTKDLNYKKDLLVRSVHNAAVEEDRNMDPLARKGRNNLVVSRKAALIDYHGPWYDEDGNYAFSIDCHNYTFTRGEKTFTIDEIEIGVKADGWIGNTYKLNDNGKISSMKVLTDNRGETRLMSLDDDKVMRFQDSKKFRHFESIGGVYLGMPRGQVEKIYGAPDSIENSGSITYAKYDKDGWSIRYEGGRVESISILKGSNRRFDRTGLGPENSLSDYINAYNMNNMKEIYADPKFKGARRIHDGEYLWLGYLWVGDGDGITFARYDN